MDENEKSVLRRRKVDIANKLQVSRDLLKELISRALVSHDGLKDIEREKTNAAKVTRVIDALLAVNPPDGFASFCSLLQNSGDSVLARLSRELEVDLRLERGDIKPRQELIDEAAVLVHRKFGPSKRFSESDKREVAELIAVKLQLSQDDWQRETERIQQELDANIQQIRSRDELAQHIVAILRDFARKHETQLTSHAHDMTTTQELVRQMMIGESTENGGDLLPRLQKNLKAFFHQVKTLLNHRDSLYYEREKCLRLLGVQNDAGKVQLDEVIGIITGQSVNPDMSVEAKDSIISRLKDQVEELDREAELHEVQLDSYRKQLADKEREIAELRRHIHIS
jgi:cell division septum initiation protein DivIVA